MLLSSARAENMEETVAAAPIAKTTLRSHSFVFLRASLSSSIKVALCCLVRNEHIFRQWSIY